MPLFSLIALVGLATFASPASAHIQVSPTLIRWSEGSDPASIQIENSDATRPIRVRVELQEIAPRDTGEYSYLAYDPSAPVDGSLIPFLTLTDPTGQSAAFQILTLQPKQKLPLRIDVNVPTAQEARGSKHAIVRVVVEGQTGFKSTELYYTHRDFQLGVSRLKLDWTAPRTLRVTLKNTGNAYTKYWLPLVFKDPATGYEYRPPEFAMPERTLPGKVVRHEFDLSFLFGKFDEGFRAAYPNRPLPKQLMLQGSVRFGAEHGDELRGSSQVIHWKR